MTRTRAQLIQHLRTAADLLEAGKCPGAALVYVEDDATVRWYFDALDVPAGGALAIGMHRMCKRVMDGPVEETVTTTPPTVVGRGGVGSGSGGNGTTSGSSGKD